MVVNTGLMIALIIMKMLNVGQWIRNKLEWNYFLRFMVQQNVTFFLATIINLYNVSLISIPTSLLDTIQYIHLANLPLYSRLFTFSDPLNSLLNYLPHLPAKILRLPLRPLL